MVLSPFQTPHRPRKAGWAARSGPAGQPKEAAGTRKGRNEVEDLERSGRLMAAAAGLEGSDAHPDQLRRNAAAPSIAATA